MPHRIVFCVFVAAILNLIAVERACADSHSEIIQRYIAAFNAKDTDAMLALVTDDVQWLSINGETVTIETNSRDELRAGMTDYFESCSSCRSRIEHMFSSAARVSALEVASFDTKKGRKEQKSVSVYEFESGLIKRVYYFPEER